jgi:uncharacterized protein YqhQ
MRSDTSEGVQPRVGGQAIIEGVMMRSPDRISAAVRLPDGNITRNNWESQAWYKRKKIYGWPIVRGAISLAEALVIGIKTLNWSADIALEYEKGKEKKKKSWQDSLGLTASLVLAIALAIGLFMWVPYQLGNLLKAGENQPLFHLIAGSARIIFFLAYLWLISQLKDIRRVFQYHGAEHQAIYTYENKEILSVENAGSQSRFHPRCGTSFILIVALLTMVIFVVFDIIVVAIWGSYANAFVRLLVHLPFLPLVAGVSYEFLRLSDRFAETRLVRLLISPGLALQRLTTREPDDPQREVALEALSAALALSGTGQIDGREDEIAADGEITAAAS